ncbi:MAG: hypothetical protein ACRD32_00465 [Nitrososphaerales archaeon]
MKTRNLIFALLIAGSVSGPALALDVNGTGAWQFMTPSDQVLRLQLLNARCAVHPSDCGGSNAGSTPAGATQQILPISNGVSATLTTTPATPTVINQ